MITATMQIAGSLAQNLCSLLQMPKQQLHQMSAQPRAPERKTIVTLQPSQQSNLDAAKPAEPWQEQREVTK